MVRDVVEIPKLGLKASRLQDKLTKLVHLHVQRPDRNSVFALGFKTDAPDHTGVPHILEHTALCGSQKFPVRDPFFKMQTRSLANYMNALTGTDYTYYPFATTNKADFQNLQQVYMDSVFSPLLREQDFLQEGWRLEPEDLADPNSPITFKGVVYNEMKGQMSMPAYYFYMTYFLAIYPSLQYSGGDPAFIPDLKYENLVNFHHEKYHPDNCFTFSYGDFGPEEAVQQLSAYLDKVKPGKDVKAATAKDLPQPIPLTEPVKVVAKGPVDPMFDANKQHKASLTWYVGKTDDFVHSLSWRILGTLLTDGHASPFYQSLIDGGIGPEFSVNTGVEETPAKIMFTIGLQGLSPEKIDTFKSVVFETIDDIIAKGFASERLDAILHQVELSDREIDANYGMSLLHRVVARAFHPNDDIMDTMDTDKLITQFKERLQAQPDFFQKELTKMKESPYFEFVMEPDAEFEAKRQAKEEVRLKEAVSKLTEQDKKQIWKQSLALAEAQSEHQNVDVLPTVGATDISREATAYPVKKSTVGAAPLYVRETPTQGLSYVRLFKDLGSASQSLLPYLPVYSAALTGTGTEKHTMAELEDLIKLHTGGIGAGASSVHRLGENIGTGLSVSASGLDTKLPQIYELLTEQLTTPLLGNVQKLKAILDASAGSIIDSMSQSGHRYAVNVAAAGVSSRKALDERLGGISHVRLLKHLATLSEAELHDQLVPKLNEIHSIGWSGRLGLTCTAGVAGAHSSYLNGMVNTLGMKGDAPVSVDVELGPLRACIPLPFQVSYVGAATQGADYFSKDAAALQVLSSLLTHRYLHTEIREKGGAYGGGASYNARDSVFTMYSYRDPSPENTLKTMQGIGNWAAAQKWTQRDVEEGTISVFQSVDAPISPRAEITYEYGSNLSDEQRQLRRELLLSVTPQDLQAASDKYLSNFGTQDKSSFAVLGPSELSPEWTKLEL